MSGKIRILFLIDYLGFGGTENHLYQLVRGLDRSKFTCIVSPLWYREKVAAKIAPFAEVIPLPFSRLYDPKAISQARRLIEILQNRQIDIVQTFGYKSDVWGPPVANRAGVRQIVSSRRDLGVYRQKRHLLLARFSNRYISEFLAPCREVARIFSERENIPREKIQVIYNGFELAAVEELNRERVSQLREKYAFHPHDFVIGNVSHFRPEKGHQVFFAAIEQLKCTFPNLKVLAVGEGPTLEPSKKWVSRAGLEERVTFSGYVKEVLEHIALMDVCCLTPISNEGFSNALLEQMALGKPVVVSDVGGNREAVEDGRSGFVIPPGDSQALSAALTKLYRDAELRHRMAKKARERIEEQFTLPHMIKRMEAFYFRLVNHSQPLKETAAQ